jgi:hypothetical protein
MASQPGESAMKIASRFRAMEVAEATANSSVSAADLIPSSMRGSGDWPSATSTMGFECRELNRIAAAMAARSAGTSSLTNQSLT